MTNPAAELLLTLMVVSTVALGGAWLLAGRIRSLAVREAIWKSALLLSLALPVVETAAPLPRVLRSGAVSILVRDPRVLDELGVRRVRPPVDAPGVQRISPLGWHARTTVPTVLFILGALNVLRLLIRWRRELAAIGPRMPLDAGPSLRELLGKVGSRPVRLTSSSSLSVPGVVARREICLPETEATHIESGAVLAVVAHEASHIQRGDLLWLRAASLCEALVFFQPLLRVARRELLRIAEFQADEAAVRATGERAALVTALLGYAQKTRVAARSGVLAFGTRESQFVQRARRILSAPPGTRSHAVLRWAPLLAVLVACVAGAAPLASDSEPRVVRAEVVKRERLAPGEPLRRRGGVEPRIIRPAAGAPVLEASQETRDGVVEATVTRAPDGTLITEFRLDGRPTAATPALHEWLRQLLTDEEPAPGLRAP